MNILFFGPNGSGKGTQGAILRETFGIVHIESGSIFRDHIKGGTPLGLKAKVFIDRGDLVPDEITIPMILDRLQKPDAAKGFILDGFPRNLNQSKALHETLTDHGIKIDKVLEIILDREVARQRIMGRRLCKNDPNHPNNIFIDAIKPNGTQCRICGGDLSTRSDDQDLAAINKRHDIYYNTETGTLASAYYFRDIAKVNSSLAYITLDGTKGVKEVSAELTSKLKVLQPA